MELKRLRETQEKLSWPSDNGLPIINWESCELPARRPHFLLTRV